MSITTDLRTIPPGRQQFFDDVWRLKEKIRGQTGFLRQQHPFFQKAYYDTTSHLLTEGNDLVGFVTIQDDGYILFLGVDPDSHGHGYGRHLIEHIANNHRTLTCHARQNNTTALEFYKHLGFEVSHTIEGYYEDGENALYLIRSNQEEDSPWLK